MAGWLKCGKSSRNWIALPMIDLVIGGAALVIGLVAGVLAVWPPRRWQP